MAEEDEDIVSGEDRDIIDGVIQDGGGGGGVLYTNLNPSTITVGGIPAGSIFNAKTMKQMWDALLYPYIPPTFSSFLLTGISTIEVGDTITGNQTFTWTTTTPANIVANTVTIKDVTGGGLVLELNKPNTGSIVHDFTGAPITKIIYTFNRFSIEAINTLIATFSRNLDIWWWWRVYYGTSVNAGPLVAADITGLATQVLQDTFPKTYVYVGGGYKYMCWPTSFGLATTFKDSLTLLNVPMEAPYIINVTNGFGIATNYYVYRTTNILGAAINIIVT